MGNGPMPMTKPDWDTGEIRQQRPLEEYPGEFVSLECTVCPRAGKLSKARLIEQYGSQMGLVNLLNALTKDCAKAIPDFQHLTTCGARYVDLNG